MDAGGGGGGGPRGRRVRGGGRAVIAALVPTCRLWTIKDPPTTETTYHCDAYNGDWAEGYQSTYRGVLQGPPINKPAVENQATRNTSRALAQAVLPVMPA